MYVCNVCIYIYIYTYIYIYILPHPLRVGNTYFQPAFEDVVFDNSICI